MENNNNFYVGPTHHRHNSDITGLFKNVTVNPKKLDNKDEKFNIKIYNTKIKSKAQASQKKIIREVFSPPIKQKKRRNQASYDATSNYGSSNTTQGSPETRNFTPNIGALKSFDHSAQRNYTSEGSGHRNVPIESLNLQRVNGFQKPVSHKSISSNMINVPENMQFVYITPYEYNRRRSDLLGAHNQNVYKIPSQRVLLDNTDYSLD